MVPDSPPARILEVALKGYLRLIVSPGIIKEIDLVFNYSKLKKSIRKSHLTDDGVADAILHVRRIATITPGAEIASGVSQDPADDMVLSCAVEGQADFIVSGDSVFSPKVVGNFMAERFGSLEDLDNHLSYKGKGWSWSTNLMEDLFAPLITTKTFEAITLGANQGSPRKLSFDPFGCARSCEPS